MIRTVTALAILALCATAALAAGPVATPGGAMPTLQREASPPGAVKALGDPTDWLASCLAGADYLVYMQADITEDNAGNGSSDPDPQDGGWDWVTTIFEHSASASSPNLYGVTAMGLLEAYQLDPTSARMTAMTDAADYITSAGPSNIRTAFDIIFLCEFAGLPGVSDPATYLAGAQAIWNYRITNYGGSATALAEYIRDARHNQGHDNGIIPWDVGSYARAATILDDAFPGLGYDVAADDIAEVLWQDSFNGSPGYFDPNGANQGADPEWDESLYYWYNLGVSGLITAFAEADLHTAEIPGLVGLLLDGQYGDGAFSDQYGAAGIINDRDWQTTAYAVMALRDYAAPSASVFEAICGGSQWLADTQDAASGAWVYGSGNHYPEVGGECAVATAYGWLAGTEAAEIGATVDGDDFVPCGEVKTVTVSYTPRDATPGLRGYEVVFEVTGGVLFDYETDVVEGPAFSGFTDTYFEVVNMGSGMYSVNATILGATPGLLTEANLFTVALTTDSDGPVTFDIVSYELRDPDNGPIFADVDGSLGFTIDCTASSAVFDIAASPRHQKVDVSWDHDELDVDHYAVFRGLWYVSPADATAYPEYDDLAGNTIPTRPVDYDDAMASTEWEHIADVAAGTLDYTDTGVTTDRGVYYYEVFAVDAAGNTSPIAVANDRATNYWLGDFDGDGDVDINDVSQLGDSFGLTDPTFVDDDWDDDINGVIDNTKDVGPTDDLSRLGIPDTDNSIDFEDLIIVAMNFGVVDDTKSLPAISTVANLAWVRLDETHFALRLTGGQGLLGLRVEAPVNVRGVAAGELLAEQDGPVFLRNLGGGLDANLAVMGSGIRGSGDLLIVDSSREIASEDLEITLRGLDNSEVLVSFSEPAGPELPTVFALERNYPNPFNPQTTIAFALPRDEDVRLAVYGVDGRLIRVLVDEQREAGRHEVAWRGDDATGRRVATGTYFAVIDAGDFHQVRKMSLVK